MNNTPYFPLRRFLNFVGYCLLVIGYSFIFRIPAYAVGEFKAGYALQYVIAPSGTTIVTQNVTLTNQLSNLYPQKYTIVIDSQNIKNVIAFDNKGMVRPTITQKDGKTEIVLSFNEKVVGLGKQLHFSLRYENADIAIKNGSIWEVNVPGAASDPDLEAYDVTLTVPASFGPNAYMSPLPSAGNRWTREQMINGGISAAYGALQAFDLTLGYHLENPTIQSKKTEIALPPDTDYQKVLMHEITPAPKTITQDGDGNWIAQYDLLPAQRMDVTLKATALVSISPRADRIVRKVDSQEYLAPKKYWESDAPAIQELAQQYKTPRDIYDYVVKTLTYDYSRIDSAPVRRGAQAAINAPDKAICMEFTDLFVAIARAAGIPAREVIGYAHTTNARLRPLSLVSDVLHAWPEYYDDKRALWIPVDPTWADTTGGVNYFDKLDFNHVVFAIHGRDSEKPYPAGFYKKSGQKTKDVLISFAQPSTQTSVVPLRVSFEFPAAVTSGFTAHGTAVVENPNSVSVPNAFVSIQSSPVDVAIARTIDVLPPLARILIPLTIPLPSYFQSGEGVLLATIDGNTAKHTFHIIPFIYRFLTPLLIAGLILIVIAVILMRPWRLWNRYNR